MLSEIWDVTSLNEAFRGFIEILRISQFRLKGGGYRYRNSEGSEGRRTRGKGGRGGAGPNHCAQREKVSLFPYPPRTGRTGLSDARAEQSFPCALVVLHAPMRWRCLNRHPLISTRRAPCAARCARSKWGKRDREHAARSISTSCTWRAKYGPKFLVSVGIIDFSGTSGSDVSMYTFDNGLALSRRIFAYNLHHNMDNLVE